MQKDSLQIYSRFYKNKYEAAEKNYSAAFFIISLNVDDDYTPLSLWCNMDKGM